VGASAAPGDPHRSHHGRATTRTALAQAVQSSSLPSVPHDTQASGATISASARIRGR
jgi:hypothetical protein